MTTPFQPGTQAQIQYQLSQQQTLPLVAVPAPANTGSPQPPSRRRKSMRVAVLALVIVLSIALFFIWHSSTPTSSPPDIGQQQFGSTSTQTGTTSSSSADAGTIEVYVIGAVKHPGVYTLPTGARVYDLLKAAGGTLPNANLVALNLAAKLSDGQEVYVLALNETPPTYVGGVPGPGTNGDNSGQLVNINTATAAELQNKLHISSSSAQKIVSYRLQHGNYTSVNQLLQVLGASVYNKIKDLVTI